ncbi:3-hydroxyacyl-CoA dehydrogenase family protein [Heyndrickxia acidiproducens]|uniref:3-hydroxyacyl-CoA dehydrogenase family protein n=1 Tax=Heyndrickxia acidiproducens TaxID=1121084 RepID=UPI000370062C|nr:3-hydroxyacyl-CoA dehydrogenase family protein [Heyndrickxia acidiproducens]
MESVSILGCGTMGHTIALCAAWANMDVKMKGMDQADIERGLSGIKKKLDTLIDNSIIKEADRTEIQRRISTMTSLEDAVDGATFVIEAAPEDLKLKQDLYQQLDRLCGPSVILASNTSGLKPTDIAAQLAHPERVVVTHFWNPAHLVPLVEVVRGKKTSDETVARSMKLIKQMNKKPIEVKKEVPGFVGNRLQFALFREAQALLEEGVATKEDIDAAVTFGIGRRLPVTGPILSADMTGLDVAKAITDYLFPVLSNAAQSAILQQLVGEQKLGDKTGEGFYNWNDAFSKAINEKREKVLIQFLKSDIK